MWTIFRNRTARSAPSISSPRTFAAQVAALRRYRTGGEQTVRVEHVTVNEGGQEVKIVLGARHGDLQPLYSCSLARLTPSGLR